MKKKAQTFSKDLKMPQLYRDDLEIIEKIIKDELKPREYKIETKDYEYDGLESIPEDNEQITDLHIQTYSPYISIQFNRFSARIYAGDDDLKTTGALTKIVEVLSARERKMLFWSQKVGLWLAPILFFAPTRALIEIDRIKTPKHWFAIGLALAAVIWWIISYYLSMYRFSSITFISSKKSPGFIKRNKDQILVGLIVGIPVAILSFFLGLFFRK